MKELKQLFYYEGLSPGPVGGAEVERFLKDSGLQQVSKTFMEYCSRDNGGCPSPQNGFLIPSEQQEAYWELCRNREIDSCGTIELNNLYGIGGHDRFGLAGRTTNTRRVWSLPEKFWVVASDGVGIHLVSRLEEGDDAVYYWEPNVPPHLYKITDSLLEFFDSLGPEPEDSVAQV